MAMREAEKLVNVITSKSAELDHDVELRRNQSRPKRNGNRENCTWAWMEGSRHYDWMDHHAPFDETQV